MVGADAVNAADLIDLTPNRHREALEWRLREFRLAVAPLEKAMVRLHCLARPSYTMIVHSDGSSSGIQQLDDGMTPEMRMRMKWLQYQRAALARSYGFNIEEETKP